MIIKYTKEPYKVYRFDVNESIIKPINNCEFNNELYYQQGKEDIDGDYIWIGLRITTHIIEKSSNKEIVGYIFEFRASALVEDKDKDLKDITMFVKNALLNHQSYFQMNAPLEISSNQLILKPKETEYAENLLSLLIESGYYE